MEKTFQIPEPIHDTNDTVIPMIPHTFLNGCV